MSGEVIGTYLPKSGYGPKQNVGQHFKRARIRDGFLAVEPLDGTTLMYLPFANIAAMWSVAVTDLDVIEGYDT